MIVLFHGSNIAVPFPLVGLGRKKVDFGQGFLKMGLLLPNKPWDN